MNHRIVSFIINWSKTKKAVTEKSMTAFQTKKLIISCTRYSVCIDLLSHQFQTVESHK